ncbi:MAG: hypothetical protein P4K94_02690 [Terracidiphilus sp.]|nr:hypothetical protein [Terracidiphilus sp.]
MLSISGVDSGAGKNASLYETSSKGSSTSTLLIATSSSSTTTITTDSINLSADYVQSVENAMGNVSDPSDTDSLFSGLNANVLVSSNLDSVGNAIDTYTSSLGNSTGDDSSYTEPSAQFLSDLASLKSAAASGNLSEAQSDLATAKTDAPENVANGMADAVSAGDTTGEADLCLESIANMSRYLSTHGYSQTGASAEASALMINGLAEYATNTSSSSAETRLQQITYLATYASEHGGTSGDSNASNPLFNIVSTLLDSQSGNAIDQSLTNLVALYSGGSSSIQQSSTTTTTTTTVQTTTLFEEITKDQENTPSSTTPSSTTSSSTAAPSTSTETALQQLMDEMLISLDSGQ